MTIYIDLNALTDGAGTAADPRNVIPSSATIAAGDNRIAFKRGMNATVYITSAASENAVAWRYPPAATELRIEAYKYSDGSDDPSYPKPIITPRVTDATGIAFWRLNGGGGGGWVVRNVDIRDAACVEIFSCSAGGGPILMEDIDVSDHLLRYVGAAPTLAANSLRFGTTGAVNAATVRRVNIDGSNDDNLNITATQGLVEHCSFNRPGLGNPGVIGDNVSSSISGAVWSNHVIRHNRFTIPYANTKHCYLHNTSTGAGGGGTNYIYDNDFYTSAISGQRPAIPVYVGHADATGSIYYVFMTGNRIYGGQYMCFAAEGDIRGYVRGNLYLTPQATPGENPAFCVARIGGTVEFSNNTMVHTLGAAGNSLKAALDMHATGVDTATVARNNVFVGWQIGVRRKAGSVIALEDHNVFSACTKASTNRDNSDAAAALGNGSVATAGVVLGSDYRPVAGGACDGAGLHNGYALDGSKRLRLNPPTIGAYERG